MALTFGLFWDLVSWVSLAYLPCSSELLLGFSPEGSSGMLPSNTLLIQLPVARRVDTPFNRRLGSAVDPLR